MGSLSETSFSKLKMAQKNKAPIIKSAVVLAAGMGERLRPITEEIPKPAMEFLNSPIIHRLFDMLLKYGIERVFVNLHHLPAKIKGALKPYENLVDIVYSYEKNILGTAGFFANFQKMLPEYFFVLNGDIFLDAPLSELERTLLQKNYEAVFLLKKTKKKEKYTRLRLSDEGTISAIGKGGHFFCGVYAASKSFASSIVREERKELAADLMAPKIKRGLLGGLVFKGDWYDLGEPGAFLKATQECVKKIAGNRLSFPANSRLVKGESFLALVDKTAKIEKGTQIFGFATVAKKSRLHGGAKIENAVLLAGTSIDRFRNVKNAIILKKKSLAVK